jgi:molybdate transport system permease protein
MNGARRPRRIPLAALAGAAIGGALFLVPLVGLVLRAPWRSLTAQLGSPETLAALRLSLVCSLGATAVSVVFGLPLAWVLARARFPGRGLLRGVVTLPLVLPPVVGGVALLLALGRLGIVGRALESAFGLILFGTPAGVVVAETFVAMPLFVLTVEGSLRGLDPRYEDAAATLGATRWTTFRRVTLPSAAPSLAAGAVLAWARALGEFGATITFAGNSENTRTIPLAVYLELQTGIDEAAALSLVLVVVSLAVLIALRDRWLGAT